MHVQQISVFLENSPGRLAGLTRLLGDRQIDLISLSIADTSSFGILRAIVADSGRALEVLASAGYTACLTDVLAVAVDDRPGSLARVLGMLSDAGIGIEYLYSFPRRSEGQALVILRTEEIGRAEALLGSSGVRTLSQEEACAL